MRRTIDVRLGGKGTPLEIWRYDQHGARQSAALDYTAGWLVDARRFAIKPGFPHAKPHFHCKTRYCFA